VRALEIDLRQKKEIILAQHTQLEAFSGSSIDALVQMDFDGHITGWNKQAEKIFGWAADDDALVQMDFDGHITGWNKQAEKIFGWAADDILDQRIDETIIPPRYRAAHQGHETVSGKRRNLGHGQPDRNPCPAP
jgi:PAS domain-containing protein